MALNYINQIACDIDHVNAAGSLICRPEECIRKINLQKQNITILCQNIRSINCNLDQIDVLIAMMGFDADVIILTECWLKVCNFNIPPRQGYKSYFTQNVYNQNDGVVAYIRESLQVRVSEKNVQDSSCLAIEIGEELTILGIYRPQAFKNCDPFIKSLDETLSSIKKSPNVVIIGDINIDIKNDNSDRFADDYLNT